MDNPRKTFLHVDMDAFFASVEQHDHPEYRGKPVVVGSPPHQRGVVSAASYEARTFGIHSAMPSRTAYQKCPQAIFLPVNMRRYQEVSRRIMQIFDRYTPLVQPLSIDEAFLDVTGSQHLFGEGTAIAASIRKQILEETGLTASVGVAPNMFLAKLASDVDKPNGLTVVPRDPHDIERWLAPLPIKRLWGAGKVTQKCLISHQLYTFGDLQQCSVDRLKSILGERAAHTFWHLSRGIDHREIETDIEEKSISKEFTFDSDCSDVEELRRILLKLTDNVASRLRKAARYAGTVHLKLRWKDFTTITRQMALSTAASDDITLRETALKLMEQNYQGQTVRLIGFGVSGLQRERNATSQLDLFSGSTENPLEKRDNLANAADRIRATYGLRSIRRGSDLSDAH
jgi:DNA polymerase IV